MSAWGTELCIVHDSTIPMPEEYELKNSSKVPKIQRVLPLATREIFRVGLGAVGFQLGLTGPSGVAGKAAGCVDLTIVDDCCVLLLLPVADPFCELAEERPFNVVDLRATSRAPGTPFDVEFPFGLGYETIINTSRKTSLETSRSCKKKIVLKEHNITLITYMIEPRGLDTVCCAPDNRTR